MSLSDLTGVVVTHNTKDLFERAYTSVRKFHPDLKIIIVDGSDEDDPCYDYVASLESSVTEVMITGYNIGHGRGMCAGIYAASTKYVLLFDSDIEMLKSPIEAMMKLFEEDTFGVGYLEKTGFDGYEYGAKPNHKQEGWMPYLHPYFQIINVNNYRKFYPYVHHGAPCYLTMLDMYKKGLSNKILKEFPGLGHSSGAGRTWVGSPKEYIRHDVAGTRNYRRKNGKPEIQGIWELNKGRI